MKIERPSGRVLTIGALALTILLAGITRASAPTDSDDPSSMNPDNPFAQQSTLPYHLPPYDRIRDSDYRPALLAGMQAQRAEYDLIAHNPAAPSFDNTIVALERSGRLLSRVSSVFYALISANSDDTLLQLESEISPKLVAHEDALFLDSAMFTRVDDLYQRRTQLQLDAQSQQLLTRYHDRFVRAGARLQQADKQHLSELNQRLSSLTTEFRQNLLRATRDSAVVVEHESDLDGLSAEQIGAAAAAARARGLDGKWLITLQNTTTQPVLTQLRSRALRQRIYQASIGRAQSGADDNTQLIAQIVRLRAERAQLLGYPSHAAYALANETAGTPEAADQMLREVGTAALAAAHREAQQIQRQIDRSSEAAHEPSFQLQAWDWQYYSEQVRRSKFDFDEAHVKRYFELDHVLQDGVFYVAHQLYGLTFKERRDLPVYQSDVRVFEVFDANGAPLALFLGDYYARDNKQGGAWMNQLVEQSHLLDTRPIVTNTLNIPKPAAGQPTLLTFDEVTTLFHEFGHALHGMLSDVQYPLLAGTNVPPDFVEYPSQLNEMWARDPAVVAHFAHDYQSGAPMPQALLRRIIASKNSDQGYAASEYIEAAMLDMAWHELTAAQAPNADQVMPFESAALKQRQVAFGPVPPRYHSPYFQHIFAGDHYAAGYYAYLWSEVLARDTGAWLQRHGGLTRANGDVLRQKILSRGRTSEPQALFEQFYGGPPEIGPLLEYRGLSLPH